jgi:cytochrome P450
MRAATAYQPPGPRPRPIVGNLIDFGRDPLGFLTATARKYGDVAGFRLGTWPAWLLNHPDLAEELFITHNRAFVKHRFFWRHVDALFGKGLLTAEGDFWLRQRRLAQPAFHRDRIAAYGETMVRLARETVDAWRPAETRDMHHEMMALTLRIVVRTLFGMDAPRDVAALGHAFDVAVQEIAARFRRPFRIPDAVPTPGNLRYRRALQQLDAFITGVIAERRRHAGDRGDLLSMLLAARDENGEAMTDRQVRDEAVTLFLAGHETTAIALSWALMLLSQHPEVDERLFRELRTVLDGGSPRAADVSRLPYTQAVVQEVLRLYPPAWVIGREAAAPCQLGGQPVAVGTTVFVSPWVMHRDPRFYDEPQQFRPDRWLDGSASRLPRFAYLPFGAGPRVCVGNGFATTEATLVLATVAQRFRPTLRDGRPIPPFPTITLRPGEAMWMTLHPRPRGASHERTDSV